MSIYKMNHLSLNKVVNKYLIIFILIFSVKVYAQTDVSDIFHPSPNVSEMNKYIDQPVSTTTGIPSIQIPIYTIKSGDIVVPISLDYHAGGIKVDQESSNVGLGWSLNAGGTVNRVEKDFIDDFKIGDFGGFMFHKYGGIYNSLVNYPICDYNDPNCENSPERSEIDSQTHAGNVDTEADVFSYNIITGSGQFIYDQQQQKFQHLELKNHKLEYKTDSIGRIYEWTITNENGTKYIFGELNGNEQTFYQPDYSESNRRSSVNSNSGTISIGVNPRLGITTWYLREIVDKTGKKVNFEYTKNYDVTYYQQGPGFFLNNYPPFHASYNAASTTELFLSKIIFDIGEVEFTQSNDLREDLLNSKRLTSIKIFSKIDGVKNLIKEVNLHNDSYFIAKQTNGTRILIESHRPYLSKRLKLDSISILDNDQPLFPQKYKFEYNMTQLPQKLSYAQDYWGGYNGEDENYLLAPELIGRRLFETRYDTYPGDGGSMRAVNKDFVTAGMLTKITYPTKGYTVYEYEPNTASILEFMPDYPSPNEYISIKNIKNSYKKTEYIFDTYELDLPTEYSCTDCTREIGLDIAYYRFKFTTEKPLQSKTQIKYFNIDCLNYTTPDGGSNEHSDGFPSEGDDDPQNSEEGYSYQCSYRYRLLDSNGNSITGGNDWFFYPPGDYYAEITFTGDTSIIGAPNDGGGGGAPGAQLKIEVYEELETDYRVVGGLRVKSISNYDYDNSLVSKKEYTYEFEDEYNVKSSSGHTMLPKLGNYEERVFASEHTGEQIGGHYIFSDSNINPSSLVGKVYYEKVRIDNYDVKNQNNKITQIDEYPFLFTQMFSYISGDLHSEMNLPYLSSARILNFMDTSWMVGNQYYREYLDQSGEKVKNEIGIAQKASLINQRIYSGFKRVSLNTTSGNTSFSGGMSIHYFNQSTYPKRISDETTEYFANNQSISNKTEYFYEGANPLQISSQTTKNSLGDILKTEYYYPQDLDAYYEQDLIMLDLVERNQIASPVITKTKVNGLVTSEQRLHYAHFHENQGDFILPKFVYTKKGEIGITSQPEDKKITYDEYDTYGNLIQYTEEGGTPVSIIWGYNGQYPIAKVEGVPYSEIATLAGLLILDSNSTYGLDPSYFDNLRNTDGALVTCYIYKPLVGVTTIIQPNGQIETYEYDSSGRLIEIKDNHGKILKKIDYHYKE